MLSHRLLEEHRIKGNDAFDLGGLKLEEIGRISDDFTRDISILALAEPEQGEERSPLLGIFFEERVGVFFSLGCEGECHADSRGRGAKKARRDGLPRALDIGPPAKLRAMRTLGCGALPVKERVAS